MSATFGGMENTRESGESGEFCLRVLDEARKVSLVLISNGQTVAIEIDPQIAREVALSLLDAAKRVEDRCSLTIIRGGLRGKRKF
jgi:hypothetical protein